jgi:hypothetical protein
MDWKRHRSLAVVAPPILGAATRSALRFAVSGVRSSGSCTEEVASVQVTGGDRAGVIETRLNCVEEWKKVCSRPRIGKT